MQKKVNVYTVGRRVLFGVMLLAAIGSKMGGCGEPKGSPKSKPPKNQPRPPAPVTITLLADKDLTLAVKSEGVTATDKNVGRYSGDITLAASVGERNRVDITLAANVEKEIELDKNKKHKLKVGTGEEVSFQPTEKGTLVIANSGASKTDFRFFPGDAFKPNQVEIIVPQPGAGAQYPKNTKEVEISFSGGELGNISAVKQAYKTYKDDNLNLTVNLGDKVKFVVKDSSGKEVETFESDEMINPFDDAFMATTKGIDITSKVNILVNVTLGKTSNDPMTFAVTAKIVP